MRHLDIFQPCYQGKQRYILARGIQLEVIQIKFKPTSAPISVSKKQDQTENAPVIEVGLKLGQKHPPLSHVLIPSRHLSRSKCFTDMLAEYICI
jgi:hypothetical protein